MDSGLSTSGGYWRLCSWLTSCSKFEHDEFEHDVSQEQTSNFKSVSWWSTRTQCVWCLVRLSTKSDYFLKLDWVLNLLSISDQIEYSIYTHIYLRLGNHFIARSSAGSENKTALDWVFKKMKLSDLNHLICDKYIYRLSTKSNIKIRLDWVFKKNNIYVHSFTQSGTKIYSVRLSTKSRDLNQSFGP